MAMSAPFAMALIVVPVMCDVISAAPAIIACSAWLGPPWKKVDSNSMPWRGRNPSSWAMIGSTCGALRDGKERLIVTGAAAALAARRRLAHHGSWLAAARGRLGRGRRGLGCWCAGTATGSQQRRQREGGNRAGGCVCARHGVGEMAC